MDCDGYNLYLARYLLRRCNMNTTENIRAVHVEAKTGYKNSMLRNCVMFSLMRRNQILSTNYKNKKQKKKAV